MSNLILTALISLSVISTGHAIKCFVGLKVHGEMDVRREEPCNTSQDSCLLATGEVLIQGNPEAATNVSVGYCIGKDECKLDEPNDIVRLINAVDSSAINFGFVAVKNASYACCQSDMCNNATVEQILESNLKPENFSCRSSVNIAAMMFNLFIASVVCLFRY